MLFNLYDLSCFKCCLDQLFYRTFEILFMPSDHLYIRLGNRMLCHKNGAAVLKRQNRCLVSVDLFGNIHDILLIKCNHRAEHRHLSHRLGSYLTDAFARYKSEAVCFFCDRFCDPHHVAAHNDRQLIMWAFLINGKLYIRKVYNVQADRSRIGRNIFCQIDNLLFCTF